MARAPLSVAPFRSTLSLPAFAALALAAAISLASGVVRAGVCYCVYGPGEAILYQAPQPPVDMSDDVVEQVQRRWPGARLVWFQSELCPPVLPTTLAEAAALRGRVDPLRAVEEGARGVEVPAPARGSEPRDVAPSKGALPPAPTDRSPRSGTGRR